MSRKRLLLTCLVLALTAGPLRADPPLPLDLIPEDACIGVAARNLEELRTKGDRLLARLPEGRILRPSQILDLAFGELKLPWRIDRKKPAAVVCMTGALGGFDADADPRSGFTLGAVVAPESLEEMARSCKVDVEDLKKGKVHKGPGRAADQIFGTEQAGYRDGEVYLTGSEKATAAWMKARTLRQAQPVARQRRLDAADGLVYLGPSLLRLGHKDLDPEKVGQGLDLPQAEAQRRLIRAALEVRYLLGGYRVDNGLGLDLSAGTDPKGTHSQAVLEAVTGSGRTSNLAGLPDSDRLVGAFAAIGLKRGDLHLTRALVGFLWDFFRGPLPVLESDSALVRRVFGDFSSRLRLARVALYQTSDPTRSGPVAAVAILEPNDPAQFLADVGQYARLGDAEQFNPKEPASKTEIEKLVAELGSDDFQTRESASTKLGLVGDAALPYLEKAEKSSDAEVRRRAGELLRTLQAAADLRKQELAKGLAARAFRSTFTLELRAEKRAGADVHLLGMRFGRADASFAGALKDLLGPEWNRLRVAVVNKQVLVLLGSELSLLDQAIANVREGKPGLEQSAALAEFRKQASPERRIELHLALARVQALVSPAADLPRDFKPGGAISSVSLWTGPADLGLDVWIPAEAVMDVGRWLHVW